MQDMLPEAARDEYKQIYNKIWKNIIFEKPENGIRRTKGRILARANLKPNCGGITAKYSF